jgi:hypothetical protein
MATPAARRTAALRTWSGTVPREDVLPLLISFPLAFAIHEAEEVVGVRWFGVEARERLSARLARGRAPRALARSAGELSSARMAVAVMTVVAGAAAATVAAAGGRRDLRPWQSAFAVFAAHAGTHVGQAVVLRTYVPGSVTAAAVVAPYSAVTIRRLRSLGLWDAPTIRRSLLTGVPAAVALAVGGHLLGSAVAPGRRP